MSQPARSRNCSIVTTKTSLHTSGQSELETFHHGQTIWLKVGTSLPFRLTLNGCFETDVVGSRILYHFKYWSRRHQCRRFTVNSEQTEWGFIILSTELHDSRKLQTDRTRLDALGTPS